MTNLSLLRSGARYLSNVPFAIATLEGFGASACMSVEQISQEYSNMSALGSAILDYESKAMRRVQSEIGYSVEAGFMRLVAGFASTGALIAGDIVVRAAVRLAVESRSFFPERDLDPFQTWSGFIGARLEEAKRLGSIRPAVNLPDARDILVSAGIGTRDFIFLHNEWAESERLLYRTALNFVHLVEVPRSFSPRMLEGTNQLRYP